MSLQMNFGMSSQACNAAMTAEYTKSNFQSEIESIKKMYERKAKDFYEDNRNIVYGGIFAGGLYNTIHTQELKLIMPILPIANQISVDVKPNQVYNYLIEWKWNL